MGQMIQAQEGRSVPVVDLAAGTAAVKSIKMRSFCMFQADTLRRQTKINKITNNNICGYLHQTTDTNQCRTGPCQAYDKDAPEKAFRRGKTKTRRE
jgi:hypothetical protein